MRRAVAVGVRTAVCVLAVLVVAACGTVGAPPAPGAPRDSGERLVLAHYFTPYPLSMDNEPAEDDYYVREYLDPDGEDGKHRRYGGLLRDRPLPVPVSDSPDWELQNYKTEIRQAAAAGIDGFTVDLLATDDVYWERTESLVRAAAELDTGFVITLMPDGSVLDDDPDELADAVASLLRYDSLHRLADGRLVVSPFHAEEFGAGWWADWMDTMSDDHGVEIALVPCFLDYFASVEDFESISHGFGHWGGRNPAANADAGKYLADARARGKLWMQPVSLQDSRPAQGVYDEANNTENLRRTWDVALSGADWVQLVTWNDYAEGTHIAPSVNLGHAALDLTSYYATWFTDGVAPEITDDVLYLSHRVHPVDAEPADQPELMELRAGGSPARDTVEVLAFLTAPAELTVGVGDRTVTERLPAGISTTTVELAAGYVHAVAVRDGRRVADVVSPFAVDDDPAIQDLHYRLSSSRPGLAG